MPLAQAMLLGHQPSLCVGARGRWGARGRRGRREHAGERLSRLMLRDDNLGTENVKQARMVGGGELREWSCRDLH